MKTSNFITTIALLLGLSVTGAMSAANHTPGGTVTPSPEKTIANYFKFPSILIPYNESGVASPVKVEVIFTTDRQGRVTYAYAKTRDLKLKKEIEKQFSTFKLPQIKENVAHSVTLNFQYIETKS